MGRGNSGMTEIQIEASGRTITIPNADKVLFPKDGFTKSDITNYYLRVADIALPYYRDRPLTMQRFPDGIGKDGFFQKNASGHFPDWVDQIEMKKEVDGTVHHVVVNSAATLVYLAGQAMISPHLGLARNDRPDYPDRMIFDLDPPGEDFKLVQSAARRFRKLFDKIGIASFVQITGSRGMHVVVSLDRSADFDKVRELARRIADGLADSSPDKFTTEQRKAKRGGRLFLDTGRNAYGQTAIGPYGIRALAGAPIATPLEWEEALSGRMGPRRYTIKNIFRRLANKRDPWVEIGDHAIPAGRLENEISRLFKNRRTTARKHSYVETENS